MAINDPVPGAPVAGASTALGFTDTPTFAEKLIANPDDPNSVTRVFYRPDGRVLPKAEEVPPEDLGPLGMSAASADDAPFSTDDIPSGWNRFPTQEEVDYLNEKYPAQFDDAGLPVEPSPPDMTGTFTAFSASSPTEAMADGEDTAALMVGGYVTLEALTGTTEAMAAIDGMRVAILTVSPTVTLDLDLSAQDTTGLTADYVREDPV
jgi:hypothetical protein